MRRPIFFVLIAAITILGIPTAAGATTVVPKTALIIGDSLTMESTGQLGGQFARHSGWGLAVHSYGGTAPCDWLQWLPADLAAVHPSVVGIETAGNSGVTACMSDAYGSASYYDHYRSDLGKLFAQITATGARVVFFNAPPFADPIRNAAVKKINAIALALAFQYHGVSIAGTVRTALSNSGAYTDMKPCLLNECVGTTTIRTVAPALDAGLHLCPTGLYNTVPTATCPVYSSGEFRFAKAMTNSLVNPPKPKLA